MKTEALISIENATLGYIKGNQEHSVLQKISFQCHKGELIGIAGINGSGKSTLLRSISGLQTALDGNIFISGEKVSDILPVELAKKVSIVLTEKISGFNLTCFDAVANGRSPYTNLFNKLDVAQHEIIDTAIKTCSLTEQRNKLLSELSDGLYQKTMIARSIAQQSDIMLLDEPSAYLDYAGKHELFILLKRLCELEHKCVLVSSHDLDLLLKYCNKILLVKDSSVELVDVSHVKEHSTFKELTGGYL